MRTFGKAGVAVGLWAVVWPLFALAQPNGIKVGEGRLHPFVDLAQHYDSAAVLRGSVFLPEMVTHVRPGLRMELLTPSTRFDLNGNADFLLYTGLVTPGSTSLSKILGEAGLNGAFNRDGAVEFQLGARLIDSDRTTNPAVAQGVISLFNEVKAALPIHPGGGALEVTPSAGYSFEWFHCCNSAASVNDYANLGFGLDGRWRFLPKTAFVLGASYDMRLTGSATQLLKATGGLQGLVSSKVTTILRAGYGHNFAGAGSTVIGQLELGYLMSETSVLRAGYVRTLQPIAVYNVFGNDRVYLDTRFLFGGKLTLLAGGGVDFVTYYASRAPDLIFSINFGPEYQFKPWLIGALNYMLSARTAYTRHEGSARITLTY